MTCAPCSGQSLSYAKLCCSAALLLCGETGEDCCGCEKALQADAQ
jgi:hypothetical protein